MINREALAVYRMSTDSVSSNLGRMARNNPRPSNGHSRKGA